MPWFLVRGMAVEKATGKVKYWNASLPADFEIEHTSMFWMSQAWTDIQVQLEMEDGLTDLTKVEIVSMPSREERDEQYRAEYPTREMGTDYEIYDFEDFEIGEDMRAILLDDDDKTPDDVLLTRRENAVKEFIKDAFDKMRTEGEWHLNIYSDGFDAFCWQPRMWAPFWGGDDFPFVLDLRPQDVITHAMHRIDKAGEELLGKPPPVEDVIDELRRLQIRLATWIDAFLKAADIVNAKRIELEGKSDEC